MLFIGDVDDDDDGMMVVNLSSVWKLDNTHYNTMHL